MLFFQDNLLNLNIIQIQKIQYNNSKTFSASLSKNTVWKNTNKSNSLPKESTQNQLISIISVAPNETLYQTQEDYNKSKITPLEWVKLNQPYNESKAINYFGSQCMKLSGRYPKFNVGY